MCVCVCVCLFCVNIYMRDTGYKRFILGYCQDSFIQVHRSHFWRGRGSTGRVLTKLKQGFKKKITSGRHFTPYAPAPSHLYHHEIYFDFVHFTTVYLETSDYSTSTYTGPVLIFDRRLFRVAYKVLVIVSKQNLKMAAKMNICNR